MIEGARILSITPRHPNPQQRETQETHPTVLVAVVDTGLKSGRLTEVVLDLPAALMLNTQLATGIATVLKSRGLVR